LSDPGIYSFLPSKADNSTGSSSIWAAESHETEMAHMPWSCMNWSRNVIDMLWSSCEGQKSNKGWLQRIRGWGHVTSWLADCTHDSMRNYVEHWIVEIPKL
jgi:hypothetical protein